MKKLLLILILLCSIQLVQAQNRETTPATQGTATLVKFYPNPATTYITFDLVKANEKGYSLLIFNFMGGRKMVELNNLGSRTTVSLSEYGRGVYIYQLRDKTGRIVESGKFQVSR